MKMVFLLTEEFGYDDVDNECTYNAVMSKLAEINPTLLTASTDTTEVTAISPSWRERKVSQRAVIHHVRADAESNQARKAYL